MPASTRERLVTALARSTDAFATPPRSDSSFAHRLVAALARYADADLAPATFGGQPDLDPSTPPAGLTETVSEATLRDQVRAVIAAMQRTTPDQLAMDAEGDIRIRAGTAVVLVRTHDDPPLVDVLSPLITGIRPSATLYERLSELTNRMPVGRIYYANETVWASVPVFGRNFQPSHLKLAVQVMTGLADELDDRLHGEFGGRRFFPEADIPSSEVPPVGGEPAPDATIVLPLSSAPRPGTAEAGPRRQSDSTMHTESATVPAGSAAKSMLRSPERVATEPSAARVIVLYRGEAATVTTAFVEVGGNRFLLADLDRFERLEHGGFLQRRRYELWASARGQRLLLFSSYDRFEFGQVARALTRAREYVGLA